MTTIVQRIDIDSVEWKKVFATIAVLRPHLAWNEFLPQLQIQYSQGYQLAGFEGDDEKYACLIGFRVSHFLAWGKILYVDDLVTHPEYRGKGHAGRLLDWVLAEAKKQGCEQVHLDSGYQRNDAHRLYLKKGFELRSHHFVLALDH